MANLTGGSVQGVNVWSWLQWGFDHVVSATDSVYEYETPNGNSVQLIGADFTYDEEGNPDGGTIEAISILDPFGNQVLSLVLGDASLADATANNFHNFWDVILGGDDTMAGGLLDDTLFGFLGNDYINGGGGDDTVDGGEGNDLLNGGTGDDFVNGGSGDDIITYNVENGDDTIHGGHDTDTVVHNGLDSDWGDIINVSRVGADWVGLELAQDVLAAQTIAPAPEIMFGDFGTDAPTKSIATPTPGLTEKIVAQPDAELGRIEPARGVGDLSQLGKKVVEPDIEAPGVLKGGGFNGEVLASQFEQFDVLLEVGSVTGSGSPDEPDRNEATLRQVEYLEINGRDGNDNVYVDDLTGTAMEAGRITFDGGAGDDDLFAFGTDTALTYLWRFAEGEGHAGGGSVQFGGSTEDIFHLLDEADDGLFINLSETFGAVSVDAGISGGGLGSDITIQNVEQMDFDFGDGDDTLVIDEDLSPAYSGVIDIDFGEGDVNLDTVAHTGRVEVTGGNDHNSYFTGSGDDLLIGGNSFDDIFAGDGNDDIFGEGGDDDLSGGAGNDNIHVGAGADRVIFNAGDGTDNVFGFVAGDAGDDVIDFLSLSISMEELMISQSGDDAHILTPFGDTVILHDVLAADLNSGDFLL